MLSMKLKTIQIKYILISFLLMVFTDSVILSQETDTIIIYKPRIYMGMNMGLTTTTITNTGIQSISALNSESQKSFSGSFELGYSFSKYLGLSIGLEFSSYSTEIVLSTYSNKFNTTDSENESYKRLIEGSGIKELQDVSFLSLPLSGNFSLPVGRKGGFFLQTSIYFSIPVIKKYENSGIFTYSGFYPAYNILLKDLPDYGFVSNVAVTSNGNPDLKFITFHGGAEAGFKYFVSKNIEILLGVNYIRSLSNIANYSSPKTFQLSSDENQINSIMGGASKVESQSLGLNLSLRYYLK
jgi:hypothetical protein